MKIKHNQNYWEEFINALVVPVLVLDTHGIILYANLAAKKLFKKKQQDLIGTYFSYPFKATKKMEIELFLPPKNIIYTDMMIKKGRWVEQDAWVVTLHDITEKKQTQIKLQIFEEIFKNAKESIIIADKDQYITNVNKKFSTITGYKKQEVLGQRPSILESKKHSASFYKTLWDTIHKEGYWSGKIWTKKKNGVVFPQLGSISKIIDPVTESLNYAGIFHDVSELEEKQKQLQKMALYDPLTGLPNKANLMTKLSDYINDVAVEQCNQMALICLDIDGFKNIINEYGYLIADRLIRLLSKRLMTQISSKELLARTSGDEFIFFKSDINQHNYNEFVTNLFDMLKKPFSLEGHSIKVKACIGLTFIIKGNFLWSSEQIIRQAEQAMYQSKMKGEKAVSVFDRRMDKKMRQTNEMIDSLKEAIKLNQLKLYYQPKVNLATGKVIGAEGLIRLEHPIKGLLMPIDIIPGIAHHPYIIELTEWTIKTALKALKQFHRLDETFQLSINIDAYELEQLNFIERLKAILSGFDDNIIPGLEFEILETSIIANKKQVKKVIKACKNLGINFLLDDFGTQYASLSNLISLPFEYVKIDKSLTKSIIDSERDKVIFQSILDIAKALNMKVVAEGVETETHLDYLKKMGCGYGQGYVFSKGLPAKDFIAWYKSQQSE